MDKIYYGPFAEQLNKLVEDNGISTFINIYYCILALVFIFTILSAVFYQKLLAPNKNQSFPCKRDVFCWLAVILLITALFPNLFVDIINVDEGMILTGSINMLHDPRPWISTDTTTIGPLTYLVVDLVYLIKRIFTGIENITLFDARLTLLLCLIFSFIFLYKTILCINNVNISQFIMLIFLLLIFIANRIELLSYNSEYLYMFFCSFILYMLIHYKKHNNIIKLYFAAFAIGMIPYIKLQFVLLAGVIFLWLIFIILDENKYSFSKSVKNLSILSFLSAAPTIIVLIYLISTPNAFYRTYLFYIKNSIAHVAPLYWDGCIYIINKLIIQNPTSLLIIIISAYMTIKLLRKLYISYNDSLIKKSDILFSFIFFIISIYSIIRPMSYVLRYNLIIYIPFIFLLMVYTYVFLKNSSFNYFMIIIYFIIGSCTLYNFDLYRIMEKFNIGNLLLHDDLTKYIVLNTSKNDSILVWGWDMRYHVYSNRKSATAQSNIERLWNNYPKTNLQFTNEERDNLYDYHIKHNIYPDENIYEFLLDLETSSPKLILDVITSRNFGFKDRALYGIDKQPIIWNYVKENYIVDMVIPVDDETILIYRRKS